MARKRRRSAAKSGFNWTLMWIMLACFFAGAGAMWVVNQGQMAAKDKRIDDLRIELTIATGRDPSAR